MVCSQLGHCQWLNGASPQFLARAGALFPSARRRPPRGGGLLGGRHQGDAGRCRGSSTAPRATPLPHAPAAPDVLCCAPVLPGGLASGGVHHRPGVYPLSLVPFPALCPAQEMLDFCGEHNITCQIERISIDYVNTAMVRAGALGAPPAHPEQRRVSFPHLAIS